MHGGPHQPNRQPDRGPTDEAATDQIARIGPNAIIRVAEALQAADGPTASIFERAGLGHYLAAPPTQMVDEREVIALQQALRATLDPDTCAAINRDAGRRTGDYLLAVRIPRPAQFVLKRLPARPAARMLLGAIAKHAWTFVGSGAFSFDPGRPVRVTIADCPTCRGAVSAHPVCDFYVGAFERLFRTLVARRASVREVQCGAQGAAACVFEITW